MFFFCVALADDCGGWLFVAGAFGVACASAAGLVAKSTQSGSHSAIRFFILNPPVTATSLPRSRLGTFHSRDALQQTWNPKLTKKSENFHSYSIAIAAVN